MSGIDGQLQALINKIRASDYILVVVGAGLSRPSGIPTFREDHWFWNGPIEEIATTAAFSRDATAVWMLYERLRLLSLRSRPNDGHLALARLARAKPALLTVSQNIDGTWSAVALVSSHRSHLATDLLQRAGHARAQLVPLHGSLYEAACSRLDCSFQCWNFGQVVKSKPTSPSSVELACCPRCGHTLRPAVCWFGEVLPHLARLQVDNWFASVPRVDLALVLGTDRFPFVHEAIAKGAEVAYFNFFEQDLEDTGDAWLVDGDLASTLPLIVHAVLDRRQE